MAKTPTAAPIPAAPVPKSWRLSIDLLDSADLIMLFDSVDEAVAHARECMARGFVMEQDTANGSLWIYPIGQVRAFNVYKR